MANPLRLFRKYQYASLVALGIMLMFAFVIAPPLSDYLHTRAGRSGGGNPVVVSWRGTQLHESDLEQFRARHILTMRFLESLVRRVTVTEEVTVERRGERVTLVKGRTYPLLGRGMNEQNEPVFQIAVAGEVVEVPQSAAQLIRPKAEPIMAAQNEEELVQHLLLAAKAREMGVVISEEAVHDYLDNLADAPPTQQLNFAALLREATGGRLDWRQFEAQLATELAAHRMLVMAHGGLAAAPPETMYDCYNQLQRRVTAELLAVDVASFVEKVPEPSEQEIVALYEEGKDRFPYPLSPEPGFKRRQQIAFGFFQGVFEEFLSREAESLAASISDADIAKYYEDNKATEFRVLELPSAANEPATPTATEPAAPPAAAPATPPPAEPAAPPAEEPAQPAAEPATPAPAAPPAAEPATPGPAAPPAAEPATPAPAAPPAAEPATPAADESTAQPAPDAAPAESGPAPSESLLPEQSQMRGTPHPVTLVSFQTPEEPAPQSNEQPAQEPAPAPPAGAPEPDSSPANEPAASPPAGEEPAAVVPATPLEPAEPASVELDAPAAAPAPAESPAPPPQYRPLDEALRAEIRTRLARREARAAAQEQMEKAIEAVTGVVERYGRQVSRAQTLGGSSAPEPLDWEAVAREHQLHFGQTPLMDVLDVSAIQQADPADGDPPYYALARATETLFGQQTGMVRRTLIDVGFAGDVAPFVVRRLVDGMLPQGGFPISPDQLFAYWREKVVAEEVPPLDAVRDEVVRAWKLQRALPLARAQAEQLAQQAVESGRRLVEVFPDNAEHVIHTNPFAWMTRGAMPGGMSMRPTLSSVTGKAGDRSVTVFGAGDDFMQAVFGLQVGQVGVAVNLPQTFVYVVRVDSEEPSDQQRREAFFAAGLTRELGDLLQLQLGDIIRGWYSSLEREYQVKWNRPPSRAWNLE